MPRSVTASGGARLLGTWRDLHAVYKPPALSSEPDRRGETSLLREASKLLGVPASELHVATRLDAMVSGVVVLAAGRDAARLVAELQQRGALERRYIALADGAPAVPVGTSGVWDAPIGTGKRGVPVAGGHDAREARTRFTVTETFTGSRAAGTTSVLTLAPETGRSHQLRIHAALAGAPLLGDVAHGGPRQLALADGRIVAFPRVFLHAYQIGVMRGEHVEWSATADLPDDFAAIHTALGGTTAILSASFAL